MASSSRVVGAMQRLAVATTVARQCVGAGGARGATRFMSGWHGAGTVIGNQLGHVHGGGMSETIYGTTILSVRKGGSVVGPLPPPLARITA